MNTEKIIHAYDGTELYVQWDIPDSPKAVVVILHGLGEHSGRYDYVTEQLTNSDVAVFRFDNRGHGKSGGARAYLDDHNKFIRDADTIVELAKQQFSHLPVFMLGHSMGGFITAAYGILYPDKLNGQILTGPLITPAPFVQNIDQLYEQPLSLIPNGLSHLICRSQQIVEDYRTDPYTLKLFTAKLFTTVAYEGVNWLLENIAEYRYPCLIMHGGEDKIVPVASGQYLFDHCTSQDKTFNIIPELYHEILNEEAEKAALLQEIVHWIEQRI